MKKNATEPVGMRSPRMEGFWLGTIEMKVYFVEEIDHLFTDSVPQLPRLPDLTPINANYYWLRLLDMLSCLKSLVNYYMYLRSWENIYLSFLCCVMIILGCLTFNYDYLHIYLMVGLIGLLCITYYLRKFEMIPRTFQSQDEVYSRGYSLSNSNKLIL